jgi:hypothetical protein
VVIVPGGAKGAETISTNSECLKIVRWQHEAGKLVAMICAGAFLFFILPKDSVLSPISRFYISIRQEFEI